jgi:hypothetical protein
VARLDGNPKIVSYNPPIHEAALTPDILATLTIISGAIIDRPIPVVRNRGPAIASLKLPCLRKFATPSPIAHNSSKGTMLIKIAWTYKLAPTNMPERPRQIALRDGLRAPSSYRRAAERINNIDVM